MSKLVVILALYAAAVSTFLLMQSREEAAPAKGVQSTADTGHPDIRKLMGEARLLLSAEIKERQKNIDLRLSRLDELQRTIEDGLQAVQETAENAADANYGKLESLEEVVRGFGRSTAELGKIRVEFSALTARMKELEERPPQVIREIVKTGPARAPTKGPVGPKRPTLPIAPKKDPRVVAEEVAKATQDLQKDDLEVLFPAIEKIREHRVMTAVPRLIEIMSKHKEEFGRAAAAAALGKMRAADAVLALAEGLVDKSDLVAQQANKSIREITDFDTGLPMSAGIRLRRTARNKVKEWWRDHEAEVRERIRVSGVGGG